MLGKIPEESLVLESSDQYPDVLAGEGDARKQADWDLMAYDLGQHTGVLKQMVSGNQRNRIMAAHMSVRLLCKLRPAVEMAASVRLAPDIEFAVRPVLADEVWGANSAPVGRVAMRLQAQRQSGDQRRIGF